MGSIGDLTSSAYGAYRAHIEREELPRATRNGAVIVAAFTSAFIVLDWCIFRENFFQMLLVRVVCDVIMLTIATVTAARYPRTSCVVGVLCAGWMLLQVIWVAGGTGGKYTPGLMLLFLGMPVLLPLTAAEAGAIVGVLVSGLGFLTLLTPDALIGHVVFAAGSLPVSGGAESVVACALLDRMRFSDFLQRREIEQARDELQRARRRQSRGSPPTSTTSSARR